ncbi:MAG: acyl carrier protein [Acidimicrobiales bacterium]|jgi:acyl carrier protein
MNRDQVLEVLSEAIVSVIGCDPAAVTPEAHLADDLEADSLALVEVIMAVEDKLDITVPEEELKDVRTVGDALDVLQGKLPASP